MLEGLEPGNQTSRREIHARFGGRQQGGISPSSRTPVVMFFTDPETGHRHGYYDGMGEDGFFHYVGEGQFGDQRLVQGNKSILNHVADGRSLEGFKANGSTVTYLGEFVLVNHYATEAHESGNPDVLRQVVVFQLRPLGGLPVPLPSLPVSPTSHTHIATVPVEERHTERAFVTPDREPYEFERREADLVHRYRDHLLRQGRRHVNRLRVVPPHESAPIYSDLWDEDSQELIEAKGSVTRDQLRHAIGQLLDYGRFVESKTRTVLVPSRPRPDLLALASAVGVDIVYPDADRWIRVGATA